MVEGYAKEYSSTETLAAAVDSKAKERREAETRMAEMPEIPEEYLHVTEPKAYLDKLKRSEEIADAECKDALKEKTAAERDLDSYQNEMDGEDLLENCERAQRELEEQKALLKHWFHIRDVFEEQKAQLRGNPMEDITKHFARYLGLISGGKVFPEFPQTDKLDMNIYSGDRLVNYRRLSEGTKETVYLAVRLAVLDHLFPNGGGVIVLDDPPIPPLGPPQQLPAALRRGHQPRGIVVGGGDVQHPGIAQAVRLYPGFVHGGSKAGNASRGVDAADFPVARVLHGVAKVPAQQLDQKIV